MKRPTLGAVLTGLAAILLIAVSLRVFFLARAAADVGDATRAQNAIAIDESLRPLLGAMQRRPQTLAVRRSITAGVNAETAILARQAFPDVSRGWSAVPHLWNSGHRLAATHAAVALWPILVRDSELLRDASPTVRTQAFAAFVAVPRAIAATHAPAALHRAIERGNSADAALRQELARRTALDRAALILVILCLALAAGLGLQIAEVGRRRERENLQRALQHSERTSVEMARRKAEDALKVSRAQFDAVFDGASLGMAILRRGGTIAQANEAFRSVFGNESEALLRRHENDFAALVRGQCESFQFEQKVTARDDREVWGDCTISLLNDDETHEHFALCVFRDITDLKRKERVVQHARTHDAPTGLANRQLFETCVRQAIADARESPDIGFAVFAIDLDRFREIRQAVGHDAGETVLALAARRLFEATEEGDIVARTGAEQVAVLAQSIEDPAAAVTRAQRLLAALAQPVEIGDRAVYVSASVGVALGPGAYDAAPDLLRDAGIAAADAKSGGRIALFDPAMSRRAERRLQLSNELRAALDRDQLYLLYQPIVDLDTRAIAGCEALIRWKHPTLGMLGPDEFLPLADDMGLSPALGKLVLRMACRQLAAWRDAHGARIRMNVNVSWPDLLESDFEANLLATIAEFGIDPAQLMIEITEHIVLDPASPAGRVVERIRREGFGICIDDFGTGYSSLAYLQRFEVDSMKIDKSFVCGSDGGVASEPIVRTLMTLARTMNLRVVAEGIETREQLGVILDAGCRLGQGYYFAKPLTPDELIEQYFAAAR